MENTFNFNRFMLLVRRQWIGLGKIYLMAWGVLAGLLIILYTFFLRTIQSASNLISIDNLLDFRIPLFVFLGLLYITIISGSYFANLGQKSKATFELLLPASRLEKFLTAIFYTALLASASYFLIYYLIDAAFVSYLRSFATVTVTIYNEDGADEVIDRLVYFYSMDFPGEVYYLLFVPYLLSAIFLLGSIYFGSFQYIKTAISLFVYMIIFSFFMYKVNVWFLEGTMSFEANSFWSEKLNVFKALCTVGVLLTFLFWDVSYLRLKEKEV